MMNRRKFLCGAISAPLVVSAANIMPVRSIERLLLMPQYLLRIESELHGAVVWRSRFIFVEK